VAEGRGGSHLGLLTTGFAPGLYWTREGKIVPHGPERGGRWGDSPQSFCGWCTIRYPGYQRFFLASVG